MTDVINGVPRELRSVLSMILSALDRDAAEGKTVRGEMAEELRALLATAQPVDATEAFCDGHCTWRDHHPNCVRAAQPAADGEREALGEENKQLKRSAKKAARDFNTLAQRLQEAERLLEEAGGWLPSLRLNGYTKTTELSDKIDAFLAGKDGAP